MLTLKQYFMGRDATYSDQLTDTVYANAAITVQKANRVLALFYAAHPNAAKRGVNSGWRPPAVNAGVKNAAPKSLHMRAMAIDVSDDDEALDRWCMTLAGRKAMTDAGLWLEHPSATPRWCHWQTVAPRSGNRVFYP